MIDRRTFLAITTAAGVALAGCLTDPTGDDSGDGDGNGPGDGDGFGDAFDVSEYAPSLAAGDLPHGEHAVAVHLRSEAEAEDALATDSLTDEARSEVETFVDETDFEAATLFYVQTRAPNACYGLVIDDLERAGSAVTGHAVAEDVSGPDEECAQVVITPAALFRARGEGDPPEKAELDVTNGWDETETVTSIPPEEYEPGD